LLGDQRGEAARHGCTHTPKRSRYEQYLPAGVAFMSLWSLRVALLPHLRRQSEIRCDS
jgi:hypothetical protein